MVCKRLRTQMITGGRPRGVAFAIFEHCSEEQFKSETEVAIEEIEVETEVEIQTGCAKAVRSAKSRRE